MNTQTIVKGSKDQYQQEQFIDEGTFGQVYRVKRLSDGSIFAMKVMRQDNSLQYVAKQHEKQMQKELKILKKLSKEPHRNLVCLIEAIYDSATTKLYIIMEYFEYGDLQNYFHRPEVVAYFSNPYILEEYVLKFSLDITCGVMQLHKNNIAHRDLKPENIMVPFDKEQNSPFLKLIDFGTCNENDFMKSTVGTFNYMAPEMLRQQTYTVKVDIWSIGCIIHEMITGRQLFAGTQQQVIIQILLFKEYQEQHFISHLIKKCLEVNPYDRISLSQLYQELYTMLINRQSQQVQHIQQQDSQTQQQVHLNSQQLNDSQFMEWSIQGDSAHQRSLTQQYQQPSHLQNQQYLDNYSVIDQVSESFNQSQFPYQESFIFLEVSQIIQQPPLIQKNHQINPNILQNSDSYEIVKKSQKTIIKNKQQSILEKEQQIYFDILEIKTWPRITFTRKNERDKDIKKMDKFFFEENQDGIFEMTDQTRFFEGYFRLLVWLSLCQIENNDSQGQLNLQNLSKICVRRYATCSDQSLPKEQMKVLKEICLMICALSLCEDASLGVIFYFHKLTDIAETNKNELLEEMKQLGFWTFSQFQKIEGLEINNTAHLKNRQYPFQNMMVNLKDKKISFNQNQMIVITEILFKASQWSWFAKDICCADLTYK